MLTKYTKNKLCIKLIFLYTSAVHVYVSSNCIYFYQSSVILLSDKQKYIDLLYLVYIRYIHIFHCATRQKFAVSIPDGVIGIFH